MINLLFRTKFESNLPSFIVFLALNALLCFITAQMVFFYWDAAEDFTMITVWLLMICLVAGFLSALRHGKEKRSRLYAQLPVTPMQTRLSYWCHAGLYLCISSFALALIMYYSDIVLALDIFRFSVLYLFHAGVLLGILSIVTGNTTRLIPEEIRKRTILYFLLATALTFLFLLCFGFVIGFYVHLVNHGFVNWNVLTLVMALLCAALVIADVELFRRKEDYLG